MVIRSDRRLLYGDILHSSIITMMFMAFISSTTGTTGGAGNAHHSGTPEITSGFLLNSCYSFSRFLVMFCRSLFILWSHFRLAIVLSVLRFTTSDHPCGIFTSTSFDVALCNSVFFPPVYSFQRTSYSFI